MEHDRIAVALRQLQQETDALALISQNDIERDLGHDEGSSMRKAVTALRPRYYLCESASTNSKPESKNKDVAEDSEDDDLGSDVEAVAVDTVQTAEDVPMLDDQGRCEP